MDKTVRTCVPSSQLWWRYDRAVFSIR